jgi:hypothetical protein
LARFLSYILKNRKMKKLLSLLVIITITACGNSGSTKDVNADTVTPDTSFSGAVITDTTGSSTMNADTSGMSQAR